MVYGIWRTMNYHELFSLLNHFVGFVSLGHFWVGGVMPFAVAAFKCLLSSFLACAVVAARQAWGQKTFKCLLRSLMSHCHRSTSHKWTKKAFNVIWAYSCCVTSAHWEVEQRPGFKGFLGTSTTDPETMQMNRTDLVCKPCNCPNHSSWANKPDWFIMDHGPLLVRAHL